jgi:hypothetical protein
MMVFQLRVVTGTPKTPSIIPKKPMVFMWRRYCPKTNRFSVARILNSHIPCPGKLMGIDGTSGGRFAMTLTKRTTPEPAGSSPNGLYFATSRRS